MTLKHFFSVSNTIFQLRLFGLLAVTLCSFVPHAYAIASGSQDIRVHILSKYHPREVTVSTEGRSLYIDSDSEFPVIVNSQDGADIIVHIPAQDLTRHYQGRLEIHRGNEELVLINEVAFLAYVASATIGESGWVEKEAMKAQAVLIATNVLRRRQQAKIDALSHIADLAYHQVYPGNNSYVEKFLSILKDMRHLPLLKLPPVYDNRQIQTESRLIDAVFHAECGSRIFSAKEIWGEQHIALQTRFFAGDFPAGNAWRKNIRKAKLDEIFSVTAGHYSIRNLQGRLLVLVNKKFYGIDDFRLMINRRLGWNTIESNDFEIEVLPYEIVFSGYGRGHGVGLCQVQSNYLAKSGWKFKDILAYFYPAAMLY